MKLRPASLALGLGLMLAVWACKAVNFTAPNGSKIVSINANPEQIAIQGGTSTITVTIFEGNGLPVPDGTVVYWTTNLGEVTSSSKTKDGIASTVLKSTGVSGTATVTVISGTLSSGPAPSPGGGSSGGGVTSSAKIEIGIPASSITLTATPASLPSGGGSVTLSATVFGSGGTAVAGATVVFSTDEGTLSSGGRPQTTDSSGRATDVLSTARTTMVTATSGAQTKTITINAGATGVTTVLLAADQVNLPVTGGRANLVATVLGSSGPLSGVAVAWSADAGSLGTVGVTLTNSSGVATNTIDTIRTTVVTASAAGTTDTLTISVGGSTGTVNVSVSASRSSIPQIANPTAAVDFCNTPMGDLPIDLIATVSDSSGNPVAGRQVTFYVDFGQLSSCGRSYGVFCDGGVSTIATTDASGIAKARYTMSTNDIYQCNCMPSVGCAMTNNPLCMSACYGKCTSTEDQFCQVAIAAISGGVQAANVQLIEYNN